MPSGHDAKGMLKVSSLIAKTHRAWWYGGITLASLGLLLAFFSVNSIKQNADRERASEWEQHTVQVVSEARGLLSALQGIDAGERGYLLTGERNYLSPYETGVVDTRAELATLKQLTRDNSRQQDALNGLDDIVTQRLALGVATVEAVRVQGRSAALNSAREDAEQILTDAALAKINDMLAEEQRLLDMRRAVSLATRRATDRNILIVFVLGMLLFGVTGGAFYAAIRADIKARITDSLKESEERFRTLSNTIPAFIFIADAKGAFTYTNQVFQSFTGKSADELLGAAWLETLHPDDRGRAEQSWAHSWHVGTSFEAEYRFHLHDDGYRVFIVRATPVRDPEGNIVQWMGTCSDTQDLVDARTALTASNARLELGVAERTADLQGALAKLRSEVTERESAEAQVRQMQKLESIGQLTGGIAHDFNNMLAIIVGSLDLAKRRVLTDPQRALKGIENAEEGARRAAQLTSRLLAYSRQQALAPEVLNVNKLVGGMSELLRRTIGESVHVETVLAGGLWSTLADAAQLESAIVNLCVNARDAMPDGGKLTIETANAHLDDAYASRHPGVIPGQYVLIGVTDTGTGMPPEVIERAFDPFYTTKGAGKGTGLGLSQVYGFVKQSGGHVKIYSESCEGTTVKVYLPRNAGTEAALDAEKNAHEALPTAKDGEIILVVEDEEAVRHMAVDVLRDLGYTVVQASDANQAINILIVQPSISLLFTDIVMPNMNGRVLADEVLKMQPALKVLFTTGYTRDAVVHNGLLDAGVAFLPKPFTVAQLARKVRRVLDGEGFNR
jgi:PAS domain S-box-containing protein